MISQYSALVILKQYDQGDFNIHRWTWISHDDVTKKEINHILTRGRDRRFFKLFRAYRGAEAPANMDHILGAVDMAIQIMKPKKNATSYVGRTMWIV